LPLDDFVQGRTALHCVEELCPGGLYDISGELVNKITNEIVHFIDYKVANL